MDVGVQLGPQYFSLLGRHRFHHIIFYNNHIHIYQLLITITTYTTSHNRQDGVLDAWDILYQQKAPILSTKVADEALNCIKVHEQGCLVAVGCNNGNTSLLELSDSLSISHKYASLFLTLTSDSKVNNIFIFMPDLPFYIFQP